ncbi:MAG: hypothetical protein V4677_01935 [Bacteroidota bacterium]
MATIKYLLIAAIFSTLIISCKKEDEGDSCSTCPVGGPSEPAGFRFTKNNGATIEADSTFFFPATKIIIAYYQGMTNRIIIKTSAQTAGTYNVNGASNTVTYIEPLGSYNATSGSIIITANANNKISGNFTSSGGGIASTIGAQFKDIPKK